MTLEELQERRLAVIHELYRTPYHKRAEREQLEAEEMELARNIQELIFSQEKK